MWAPGHGCDCAGDANGVDRDGFESVQMETFVCLHDVLVGLVELVLFVRLVVVLGGVVLVELAELVHVE